MPWLQDSTIKTESTSLDVRVTNLGIQSLIQQQLAVFATDQQHSFTSPFSLGSYRPRNSFSGFGAYLVSLSSRRNWAFKDGFARTLTYNLPFPPSTPPHRFALNNA
jgi:hypothetical protein